MNPKVMAHMHGIIRRRGVHPKRALDVGGRTSDAYSLLRFPEVADAERWCINLQDAPSVGGIQHVIGSANDMHMFDDDSFDLVMCNAMIEHDPRFWLSLAEMHRVLAPGGLLVLGAPGFVKSDADEGSATRTYRVHWRRDYYRFSVRAAREVWFDGLEQVTVRAILDPPRVIGAGVKPRP